MILTHRDIFLELNRFFARTSSSPSGLVDNPLSHLHSRGDFESALSMPFDESSVDFNEDKLVVKNLDRSLLGSVGFDLRVGEVVYRANSVMEVRNLSDLEKLRREGAVKRMEPDSNGKFYLNADLEGNEVYYVPSSEVIRLPRNLSLVVDAKSTSGRLAVLCNHKNRRALEFGEEEPVITSFQLYAFPLVVTAGKSSIVQAVLRQRNSDFMNVPEVRYSKDIRLYYGDKPIDLNEENRFSTDGVAMTFSSRRGYVARPLKDIVAPIDIDLKGAYKPEDYFEQIEGNGSIVLEPRRFYLLGARERISLGPVCGVLSRDSPDTGSGLWVHFAGLFWPGFDGESTMECRSETRRIVRDGDYAGFMRFDSLSSPLENVKLYTGAYQGQSAPKLPKVFA